MYAFTHHIYAHVFHHLGMFLYTLGGGFLFGVRTAKLFQATDDINKKQLSISAVSFLQK